MSVGELSNVGDTQDFYKKFQLNGRLGKPDGSGFKRERGGEGFENGKIDKYFEEA